MYSLWAEKWELCLLHPHPAVVHQFVPVYQIASNFAGVSIGKVKFRSISEPVNGIGKKVIDSELIFCVLASRLRGKEDFKCALSTSYDFAQLLAISANPVLAKLVLRFLLL